MEYKQNNVSRNFQNTETYLRYKYSLQSTNFYKIYFHCFVDMSGKKKYGMLGLDVQGVPKKRNLFGSFRNWHEMPHKLKPNKLFF